MSKEIETLHRQLEILTDKNTTDMDEINCLVEINPEAYTLVRGLGDIILQKAQLSRSSSSDSEFDSDKDNRLWSEHIKNFKEAILKQEH